MLDRIKDEFVQTLREYEAIYKSAVAFGLRKRLIYQADKEELEKNIYEIPAEVEDLENSIADLKNQIVEAREAGEEARTKLMATREEEIAEMKAANEGIKV